MMAKHYQYIIEGYFRFKVIKRWLEKNQEKRSEHIVSKVKGHWHCDCLGYKYSSPLLKLCDHIKFINTQLQDNPKFFLLEEKEFDWNNARSLEELTRRFG